MHSQILGCYQENISFYDGYNTQGTLSQEKIINVMTCEKLAWRGNVKSIALWVELLGIMMWSFCQSRDLKATALSLCSCEEVSCEKWLKFVSTALKRSARKLNVKSVSLCQTGDIKATALCEVGWRIMESVCQLHSRALRVKFWMWSLCQEGNSRWLTKYQGAAQQSSTSNSTSFLSNNLSANKPTFDIDVIIQRGYIWFQQKN